jgi:hypothetical protein
MFIADGKEARRARTGGAKPVATVTPRGAYFGIEGSF